MPIVHEHVRVGRCEIDPSVQLCVGAIVGKRYRPLLTRSANAPASEDLTIIRANAYVGCYAIVGSGSRLSERVIVDDHCSIESDVCIGEGSLIIYRAQICNEARIGERCVIGGFIGERTEIGHDARIFGRIVHSQHDPSAGWDDEDVLEPAAVVEPRAFVGFDATLVGGVTIETGAYVCAGAIVTRSVPKGHIAFGTNQMVSRDKWKGSLSKSRFFNDSAKS